MSQKFSGFFQFSVRNYASPNRIKDFKKPKVYKQIEADAISMKSKGFLRSIKPYDPPKDFNQRITDIAKELNITNLNEKRFEFLSKCATAFNHAVPNSQLYEMKTINNVIDFYATPIDCHTPYETLVKKNTQPNLHIIPEARRYDSETDGLSAFPKSSTIVMGLKNRKKYKGHIEKSSWP